MTIYSDGFEEEKDSNNQVSFVKFINTPHLKDANIVKLHFMRTLHASHFDARHHNKFTRHYLSCSSCDDQCDELVSIHPSYGDVVKKYPKS